MRLGQFTGEHLPRRFAHHRLASLAFETSNQREVPFRSAHFIPRQPETVGVAQFRFVVVLGQVFFQKDEFSLGAAAEGFSLSASNA